MAAQSKLRCFVCRKKEKEGITVKRLDQAKFQKCSNILAIRKAHKLIYNDAVLPAELSEENGYHPDCYKNFTALAKKYTLKTSNEPAASTSRDEPVPSTSSKTEQDDHSKER